MTTVFELPHEAAAAFVKAVRDAVSAEMPASDAVLDAIRRGVENSMPYAAEIVAAILSAPVPLPPGSHVVLPDGTKGVTVLMMRTLTEAVPHRETGQVFTERGNWVSLGDNPDGTPGITIARGGK